MARCCHAAEACSPQAVRIQPGAMQLTRTAGARERASESVNPVTAPLIAPNISPLSPSIPWATWSHPIFNSTAWLP